MNAMSLMKIRSGWWSGFGIVVVLMTSMAVAQRGGRWWQNGGIETGRNGVPDWGIDQDFKRDVFTFVRIKYESVRGRGRGGGGWRTDYRDSDLNFSLRLQQLTSLKVDPEPIVLELTDDRLFDYPFIYIIEPGALYFSEAEVKALRRY
ncbi:MAG: DUF4159 domain-containing protein, partial [Rubripirellula sp.]|nr:DUF4159 domain-containing protein [Rubripirellula sp.]